MSESDESGMGIVRRRRSRRMLETRRTASKDGDDARVTTDAAAAAWGDILAGNDSSADDVIDEISTPPAERAASASPRIVDLQSREPGDQLSRPVRGPRSRGPAARPSTASAAPKAMLRGKPLSGRPGEIAAEAEQRAARVSEAPRRRISQQVPALIERPRSAPAQPAPPPSAEAVQTADFEADNSLLRAALRATAPSTAQPETVVAPVPTRPAEVRRGKRTPAVTSTPPPGESILETLESAAPEAVTHEAPRRRSRRGLFGVIGVILLFVGACVWSTAIVFDEMERSARLNRVADVLDTRVAHIVEENPQLGRWVKERDAAALQTLSEKQLPLFRETLIATGYAEGVPKVKMLPDSTSGRLIVEVTLPDAALALDSDGDWVKRPPRKGFGAAVQANFVPIVVSLSLPTLTAIIWLLAMRRRRRRQLA